MVLTLYIRCQMKIITKVIHIKGESKVTKLMNELETIIFFDESGKKDDHPIMMGGLSIPKSIYSRVEFNQIQGIKSHWVDFKHKTNMKELINTISKFESLIKVNVINYDYNAIEEATSKFPDPKNKEFAIRTIYAKFPERIFYGLLRGNVKHISEVSDIVIEKASEYENFVKDVVEKHLNVQAIYRGENFTVNTCLLKPKGTDVGLEITDLLLGIIRFIIKNEARSKSKRQGKKIEFIIDLLKKDSTYCLFSKRVMFFEWTKDNELREVDFNSYLKAFITRNHDLWF